MHHRVRNTLAPWLACSTLVLSGPARATTLDAFTSALPPNPCLPNTGAPVVFVGPYCDGAACPPDALAECEEAAADQPAGLAGVLAGLGRVLFVASSAPEDQVNARIDTGLHLLQVGASTIYNHQLHLTYATPDINQNLDLAAAGLVGLEFDISGTISPSQPLHCQVTLLRQEPIPGGFSNFSAETSFPIEQPGTVSVPFSSLLPGPGFSLSAVDQILIVFDDCDPFTGCTVANPPARSYALGPITLTAGAPTAARRASWSSLKAHYR